MIEVLAKISATTWGLFAGAAVALGANVAFGMKVLNRLNTDPLDERQPTPATPLTNAVESHPEASVRSTVAAPRPRRIQSVPPPEEAPAPVAAPEQPVKLATPPVKETELAEPVLASAAAAPKEEKKTDLPLKSETQVPAGALVLGSLDAGAKVPLVPRGLGAEAKETVPPAANPLAPAAPAANQPDKTTVPPRRFFDPIKTTIPAPASGTLPPAAADKESTALPPLSSVIPPLDPEKKAPLGPVAGPLAAPGATDKPLADLTALKEAGASPVPPASKADAPKIEAAGDGLLAVSGPAKVSGGPDVPPVAADLANDVKKNTPPTPAPESAARSGLVLIPPAEAKPEPAAAKPAEKPAEPVTAKAPEAPAAPAPKPEEKPAAAEKAAPEPVLSPAVADEPPAAKPESEAKPVKGPRVFLPGRFFGRGKEKETVAAEPKADKEAAEKAAEVPAAPAKTEPELVPAVAEAKQATPEAKKDEKPVETPEAKKDAPPAATVEEPKAPAPAAKDDKAPAAKKDEPTAKPEPVPAAKSSLPVDEKAAKPAESKTAPAEEKPAAKSVVPGEKTPAAAGAPTASLVAPPLPTQAAPATAPIAEPLAAAIIPTPKPKEAPVEGKAETPAKPAAPSAPAPVAPVSQPNPVMPPNDTTTSLPNNGRASAQLTLGFEITSLQLTPFFKLGSVQLKALSNVVSLHLVAAQAADNPLAAGISFQIEHVDLDGAAHIKSILLKPLGESREATVPVSKLQVENVAVTGGGEGAPISVTTSNQASTAVQLFGTFTIAAMDFTPAFEIGSLRLEPTSNTVLLRVAPSSRPTALDLPPSFEVAAVQLGDGAQISGVRLTPSGAK